MNPFRNFQGQMLKYVLRHPQLKKMVEQGAQYTARNPTARKMQSNAKAAFENVKSKANGSAWGSRIFAFVAANFLGVILLLPMFWGALKHTYRSLTESPESESKAAKRKRAQEKEAHDAANRTIASRVNDSVGHQPESETMETAQPIRRRRGKVPTESTPSLSGNTNGSTFESTRLFDDTKGSSAVPSGNYSSFGGGSNGTGSSPHQAVDFGTSFLVKMGDEDKFTSFVDREEMTGKMTKNN